MKKEHKFINPYNFIPLGNLCQRTSYQDERKYSGYIECELKTLTPLIMIDSSKGVKDEDNHMIYSEVFMLKDKPVIPASELRGMIRNKFEILTNSCLVSSQKELAFFGRHEGNMRNPGILDFSDPDNIKLYKCNKYEVEECDKKYFNNYRTGDFICFDIRKEKNRNVFDKLGGSHEGYVKIGETFNKKNAIHIFELTNEIETAKNEIDFKNMYDEICERYHDNFERYCTKEKNHNSQTNKDYRPIWYEKIGNYIYFSLGQNGQAKSKKIFKDLVDPSFLPCKDKNNLCEACSLFGTVQNDFAVSSKVRFEDAYLKTNTTSFYATDKPIILDELATPKYYNALFYMRLYDQIGLINDYVDLSWNVDFKSKFSMNKNKTFLLEEGDIEIRGRKQYWHHKPDINKKVEKTKRNISVRPLKDNLVFTFKIYFDDITKSQLEHLNMAICLENDSNYAHKLGLGKPLGYGSVKIKTNKIIYKEVVYADDEFQYILKEYKPQYKTIKDTFLGLDEEQFYAIIHMFNTDFIKDNIVDYPRNIPNGKIYEWFQENKKGVYNPMVKEKCISVLPFADFDYDYLIQQGINNKK